MNSEPVNSDGIRLSIIEKEEELQRKLVGKPFAPSIVTELKKTYSEIFLIVNGDHGDGRVEVFCDNWVTLYVDRDIITGVEIG